VALDETQLGYRAGAALFCAYQPSVSPTPSWLSWVLWAHMFSRSAAVGSTEYFSVSSYEEVMCTGLRWNKRTMQEKITSIGIRSVMILGVSGLYHDNTHRKPQ